MSNHLIKKQKQISPSN